jgi:hypothetical protein
MPARVSNEEGHSRRVAAQQLSEEGRLADAPFRLDQDIASGSRPAEVPDPRKILLATDEQRGEPTQQRGDLVPVARSTEQRTAHICVLLDAANVNLVRIDAGEDDGGGGARALCRL